MRYFESSWQAFDNLPIFWRLWEPEEDARAVVCLLHGLGEHSGRYVHVAEALTQEGFALLALDLRGHGRSGGPRGHTPSFESFMKDIDLMIAEAAARFPGKPKFLYGHSMGGGLALNYVLRRSPELNGVVVTGAGLRTPLRDQKVKLLFARLAGAVLPALSMPSGLDAAGLSRDASVVEAYQKDPLVHDRATLRMANESFQAIDWAIENAGDFHLPLLLMHGTEDYLAYSSGSQEFAGLVSCECDLKLWEGCYHELHNEPEQKEVFKYLIDWLNDHCSQTVLLKD